MHFLVFITYDLKKKRKFTCDVELCRLVNSFRRFESTETFPNLTLYHSTTRDVPEDFYITRSETPDSDIAADSEDGCSRSPSKSLYLSTKLYGITQHRPFHRIFNETRLHWAMQPRRQFIFRDAFRVQ